MVIINPMEASTSTITSSNGMISTNTPKAGPVTTDSKTSTRDRKSITFEDHILCESAVPEKRKAKVSVEVSVESSLLQVKKPIGSQPRATKSRAKIVINEAPTAKLNVYVCGEGISGELGLGTAKNAVNVKRPRLNPLLSADEVGVVQIAVGSMHCVALTHDNKILTWGVNDQGALGRNTGVNTFSNIKDRESGISCSQDSAGLNPYEAIPVAIPSTAFPESTIFVEVAAGESSSFVLTDEGLVYGWGTFRSNNGILGFDAQHRIQATPMLIKPLKHIKHLACGDNHVLALDMKGCVFSWGCGQQNQLGRRIVERNKLNGLQPQKFGLPRKMVRIGCGAFHAFAVHESGRVYAWGLNSFGETGLYKGAGDNEAAVLHPTVVHTLTDKGITQICGGAHHSLAITRNGECLVWGRVDGYQTGLLLDSLPSHAVLKDDRGHPRILTEPTVIPRIQVCFVAAGSDHSLAIDVHGNAWSWGFSATYQTGQGTQDDVETATIVENTAVRGRKLSWAGGGGQFSVFTELAT